MSNLPPAAVLAKRLEHELTTAKLCAGAGDPFAAERRIEKAQEILAQLQEAMR